MTAKATVIRSCHIASCPSSKRSICSCLLGRGARRQGSLGIGSSCFTTGHLCFDLFQCFSLGLRYHGGHEDNGDHGKGHVEEEGTRRGQGGHQSCLTERHEDVGTKVHHGGRRQGRPAHAQREDLGNHQPGNGSESHLVGAHVDHQGHNRDDSPTPRNRRLSMVHMAEGEGGAQQGQGQDHAGDSPQQQLASAVLVHFEGGEGSGQQLDQAHSHGAQGSGAGKAGALEDVGGEDQDGWLTCDLLKEDEAASNDQWLGITQGFQASGRRSGPGRGVPGIAQHDVELLLDLRRGGSAEEGQSFLGLAGQSLIHLQERAGAQRSQDQPTWRVGNEDDAHLHQAREHRGDNHHEAPARLLHGRKDGAGREAQEYAQGDDHLLGGDQGAPHRGRRDLGDVDGRRVHAEAYAETIDQETNVDPPQIGRQSCDGGAQEIESRTNLHLLLAAHDIGPAETDG
mmetsp:Transcript_84576/g.134027  ORF Transcript_84576/g.134027 Transcript_84576/m.134027 type:complete len:454 (-) Transcript_84576:269-1630(-)